MDDITDVFNYFLKQYRSVDIAESEFKKSIHDDAELRTRYREWCHNVGSSEKDGFSDYCEEYIDSQNSIWETLNDFDNE